MNIPDAYCTCGHHAGIHTPTGSMSDTAIRGHGYCTAGRCICDRFASVTTTGSATGSISFPPVSSSVRAEPDLVNGPDDSDGGALP